MLFRSAHQVQRYVGAFKGRHTLSALGGTRWSGQKAKAKGAVADLASEMLRVQAIRESAPGIAFPDDTSWMREFESSFPWEETVDQIDADRKSTRLNSSHVVISYAVFCFKKKIDRKSTTFD